MEYVATSRREVILWKILVLSRSVFVSIHVVFEVYNVYWLHWRLAWSTTSPLLIRPRLSLVH